MVAGKEMMQPLLTQKSSLWYARRPTPRGSEVIGVTCVEGSLQKFLRRGCLSMPISEL